jgi:hypothetical protein
MRQADWDPHLAMEREARTPLETAGAAVPVLYLILRFSAFLAFELVENRPKSLILRVGSTGTNPTLSANKSLNIKYLY